MFDCSSSNNSTNLKRQLAIILKCPSASFFVRNVEVQRQSETSDCGLFAIAFAHTLCLGLDALMILTMCFSVFNEMA